MARVFTTGWELGHTGDAGSGTIHEADVTARMMGNIDTVTNPARAGGRALRVVGTTRDFLYAGIDVPATDEFWLRWAFQYRSTNINTHTNTFLSWAADGGVVGGVRYQGDTLGLSLWSGSDLLNGGSSETMLASEPGGVLKRNRWQLFELHWKTDGSAGAAELRVDGMQVITFSGNTDDGKGQVTQIRFGFNEDGTVLPGGSTFYYDDCAMDNADWIGDGHVMLLRPNGNGNSSQLTGSDGDQADNYQLVNETPAENSDYVEGAAAGLRDTYAMEDTAAEMPANAEIKHVDVVTLAHSLSVGSDAMRGVVRTGGSDHLSSPQTLRSSFGPHRFGFPLNPDTGLAWTPEELDAVEAGIETA